MQEITIYNFDDTLTDIAGQLAPRSRRIYANDAKRFAIWLMEHNLIVDLLTRSHMLAYRGYLGEKYAKSTAQRMFTVAKKILQEKVESGELDSNPANNIKNFKRSDETSYIALTAQQCKGLLASIDRFTVKGLRDYALILFLIRTGLRRFECSALTIGDIKTEQGHIIAEIKHGKGDKKRFAKVPTDVYRAIQDYISAVGREESTPDTPLFTGINRKTRLHDKTIERTVKEYGAKIDVPELTPHCLRATFITLALENGAPLQKVQYAAGHSDPRTTERYQQRKLNLDDNAVDYIHF